MLPTFSRRIGRCPAVATDIAAIRLFATAPQNAAMALRNQASPTGAVPANLTNGAAKNTGGFPLPSASRNGASSARSLAESSVWTTMIAAAPGRG